MNRYDKSERNAILTAKAEMPFGAIKECKEICLSVSDNDWRRMTPSCAESFTEYQHWHTTIYFQSCILPRNRDPISLAPENCRDTTIDFHYNKPQLWLACVHMETWICQAIDLSTSGIGAKMVKCIRKFPTYQNAPNCQGAVQPCTDATGNVIWAIFNPKMASPHMRQSPIARFQAHS